MTESRELFGSTSLFGDLEPTVLDRLSERAVNRHFSKGEFIFHEGDPGDSLFVICSGLVRCSSPRPPGTNRDPQCES